MTEVQNPDGSFHHRAVIHSVTFTFPDGNQKTDVLEAWQDIVPHILHIMNEDNSYIIDHGRPNGITVSEERYKKYTSANQYFKDSTVVAELNQNDIDHLTGQKSNGTDLDKLFDETKASINIRDGHHGPNPLQIINPNGEMKRHKRFDI
jgi:hypothetical protein